MTLPCRDLGPDLSSAPVSDHRSGRRSGLSPNVYGQCAGVGCFVLLLVGLGPIALAAPSEGRVQIQGPATPPHEGEAIPFTVSETADGPLFIDGCAAVELEQKTVGIWSTKAVKVCETQVPATQFDGGLALSIPAPDSGTYRALLTWGVGCAPGFPLVTATCTEIGSVTSDPVVVAPRRQPGQK
ncbi:MAG: hypothetical protein EXR69_02840 [Myxococcales bacterium]|nr:hypothetical protein [Myxococcales bacterium]